MTGLVEIRHFEMSIMLGNTLKYALFDFQVDL